MDKKTPDFLKIQSLIDLFSILDTEECSMLRIVGGAVRNCLMGLPITDIDLATVWTPEDVTQKCRQAGLKVIPTGVDHGTVTVISGGDSYEITTLRKDVETDGRRAVVTFTHLWEEDAVRRDFTVNALYMGLDGEVFDPLETGVNDIMVRAIRFIGDGSTRIKEDALRILRFYRFYAQYGVGDLNARSVQACREHVELLQTLSKERVTEELLKICSVDNPVDIFEIMRDNNVFSTLNNFIPNLNLLIHIVPLQKQYDIRNVLSILFCVLGCAAQDMASFLALSKKQKSFLIGLEKGCADKTLPLKQVLYKYGYDLGLQILLLKHESEEDISFAKTWDIPLFPIKGQDLLDCGVKVGPEVGVRLMEVEQWWVDLDFQPNRETCLAQVKVKSI
ncbi:MAG: CCA tRNA nucleotidyltransferase [Alphaproteobacteria bacterium]|nr:CCA tRNA nucleotidyltransferase [Alphaproteobacteria bacterium]